ncbi:hypothetical protein IID19_05655 [Patescibacteria group bacterium]|nr:hypothetical protein [Patescibacteria group bacterium]
MTLETIILILHITGASLLIGVAIIATASVVKPPQTVKFINWLYKTGKFGLWISFWELLTGTILFFQRSSQLAGDHLFWVRTGFYYITGSVLASIVALRQSKKILYQINLSKLVTSQPRWPWPLSP